MLPLHQSSIFMIKHSRFNHKKKQDHNLALLWWGRRDSNSYTLRRWNLNPVRLPISPRPHLGHLFKINVAEDQGLEP